MSKKGKFISIAAVLIVVISALFFIVIVKDSNKVLNYGDVVDFEVQELKKNNREYLIVSGEYNGSSLRIKEIKEEFKDGDIIVKVHTTLTGRNDASFAYIVRVDDFVDRVLFGEEQEVIWNK